MDMTCWLSVTGLLIACTVTLLTVWVWKAFQTIRIFNRLGIPGPQAWPFILHNYVFLRKGLHGTIIDWTRQYPNIYGCFLLGTPTVVVSDLDLVRDVMVKRFGDFPNRVPSPVLRYKPWTESLLNLRDDHWKHVRSQLSPTFSSGKLRKMTIAVERVVKNLDNYIKVKAETGEEVELKTLCRSFAMDTIAGVAFGLEVDSLKNPEDLFIKHGTDLTSFGGLIATVIVALPFLVPVLRRLGITFPPQSAEKFFMNVLDSSIEDRRQDNDKNHADFVQLLLQAETDGAGQGHVDAEIDHGHHLATSTQWSRKGLTKDEMYANTLTFLFGGNETVSTTMSFTLFCLAASPQCLAKAQAEVDKKLGKKPVTYEGAKELTYLDMSISEAIRIFPPGFILEREVSRDTELGGYRLTKGMKITVPAICIHRDPAIWPDPMKFDPERHTPEARASRHPFAFLPFGHGPRNCIAMRLAQLEIRMALASVLQHFTPRLCDKSVYPPKLHKIKLEAEDGLWVRFEARA